MWAHLCYNFITTQPPLSTVFMLSQQKKNTKNGNDVQHTHWKKRNEWVVRVRPLPPKKQRDTTRAIQKRRCGSLVVQEFSTFNILCAIITAPQQLLLCFPPSTIWAQKPCPILTVTFSCSLSSDTIASSSGCISGELAYTGTRYEINTRKKERKKEKNMHQRKIVGNNTHSNQMKRIKLKQVEVKKKKKSIRRRKKTTHQTRSHTQWYFWCFVP